MKKIIAILSLAMMTNVSAQTLKNIAYKDGAQKLNALATGNTNQKRPAVLILPAWKGIDNEAKQAALDLQKEG
ncbi:hypothetical protein [Soonwooa sp.]|uniref:hypothetical protein n=1 Tax=Soonwooa sp. TaxID=1938592 RepID=UPI0028AA65BE|nr:hypothetical protein [Soonwooa sp.]